MKKLLQNNNKQFRDSCTQLQKLSYTTLPKGNHEMVNSQLNSFPPSGSPFTEPVDFNFRKSRRSRHMNLTITYMHLYYKDDFIKQLEKVDLIIGKHYSIFIKIRFNKDLYRMVGHQFQFTFSSLFSFEILHETVDSKIKVFFQDYKITASDVVYIILTFVPLKTELLSDFSLDPVDKEIIYKLGVDKDMTSTEKLNNIPITTNFNNILTPIDVVIKNGICVDIPIDTKDGRINLLDLIRKQTKLLNLKVRGSVINEFDNKWLFYLVDGYLNSYRLAYRYQDTRTVRKIRYSLQGVILEDVKDVLSEQNENVIVRYYNNYEYTIENNLITKYKYNMNLIPIKRKINSDVQFVENVNIGVIDFETLQCKDGINRVYCLGFKTVLNKYPVTYFVDKEQFKTSGYHIYDYIVLEMINELLDKKYKDIHFYAHHLGGFDVVFLLDVLFRYNENNKANTYKLDFVFRDKNILKITIFKKIAGENRKLIIKDSLAILTSKLKDLCKNFEVNTLKLDFPYKFLHEDNLSYIGNTPDIAFYDDLELEEYKLLFINDWSFKEESLIYLKADLDALYQVIRKANLRFFLDYGEDITKGLTISSIALSLYHNKYYQNNIPSITNTQMYRDIKEGYYGGTTSL